ncbi:MAG: glycosyltransferase family 4 protein [Candidatus Margulisiibacteriota bacterium]
MTPSSNQTTGGTSAPISVLHIIIGLQVGGAETMLKRVILAYQNHPEFSHSVVSLTKGDTAIGKELQNMGIPVTALHTKSFLDTPRILVQLYRHIRHLKPTVVQTWMYHGNCLGGLAAKLTGMRNIVWNIRCTNVTEQAPMTKFIAHLNAFLSKWVPQTIICCAHAAAASHTAFGYSPQPMVVIPNGYDIDQLQPDPNAREAIRTSLGIPKTALVIGGVGRFNPVKDYKNFITACGYVYRNLPQLHVLLVGRNLNTNNTRLMSWIQEQGLGAVVHLVDEQPNVTDFLSAMDVFCFSSISEGFPNVVCEAMITERPCVVTKAGDTQEIIGDTGTVVPPQNSQALGEALLAMCQKSPEERLSIGQRGKQRIANHFSLAIIAKKYHDLYRELANANSRKGA